MDEDIGPRKRVVSRLLLFRLINIKGSSGEERKCNQKDEVRGQEKKKPEDLTRVGWRYNHEGVF